MNVGGGWGLKQGREQIQEVDKVKIKSRKKIRLKDKQLQRHT